MIALESKYGTIKGVSKFDTYPDGQPRDCELIEENHLMTPYGTFIPQYSEKDFHERQKKDRSSVRFFRNGRIKSIALEKQMLVKTPCGDYMAEALTFYEDGSLKRFFPLNGRITGYWTEDDEAGLAEEISLELGFGSIRGKIMSVLFYPGGALRSITLWPGESLIIPTPIGDIKIRIGLSFYENGNIKSIEPYEHTEVATEIGSLMAYDPEALGIHGDSNSLVFSEDGKITKLSTLQSGVLVTNDMGLTQRYEARQVDSYVDESDTVLLPLVAEFSKDCVRLHNGEDHSLFYDRNEFMVYRRDLIPKGGGCGGSCASCGSSCG